MFPIIRSRSLAMSTNMYPIKMLLDEFQEKSPRLQFIAIILLTLHCNKSESKQYIPFVWPGSTSVDNFARVLIL